MPIREMKGLGDNKTRGLSLKNDVEGGTRFGPCYQGQAEGHGAEKGACNGKIVEPEKQTENYQRNSDDRERRGSFP